MEQAEAVEAAATTTSAGKQEETETETTPPPPPQIYTIENAVTKKKLTLRRHPGTIEEVQEQIGVLVTEVGQEHPKAMALLKNVAAARAPLTHPLWEAADHGQLSEQEFTERADALKKLPVVGLETEERFSPSDDPERVFQSLAMVMDDLEYLFVHGLCGAALVNKSFRVALQGKKDVQDMTLVNLYVQHLNHARARWITQAFQVPVFLVHWRAIVLAANRDRDAAIQVLMERELHAPPFDPRIVAADASDDLQLRQAPEIAQLRREHLDRCEVLVKALNERDPGHTHVFWVEYGKLVQRCLERCWEAVQRTLIDDEMYVRVCYLDFMSMRPENRYEACLLATLDEDQFAEMFRQQIVERSRSLAVLATMLLQHNSALERFYLKQRFQGRAQDLLDEFADGPGSPACMADKMCWLMVTLSERERSQVCQQLEQMYQDEAHEDEKASAAAAAAAAADPQAKDKMES